jgi:Do/DeqQ family serine protease
MRHKLIFFVCAFIAAFITTVFCFSSGTEAREVYKRENAVVRAVKKVSPAVVNISTEYEVSYRSPFSGFAVDDFFRDFFDHGFEQRRKLNSLGSGVIIDGSRGYILTNAHVIVKSGRVTAVLKDGREFDAEIVGADPESDLAVLQIKTDQSLPSVEMGISDDLMIGETVIAIGNPFGFSNTVTTGVISAIDRSFKADDQIYRDFIQTDASINPGNSGGPLLNINGELIGINTAIYRNAEGIGFAIPINRAKKIVADLITYGEVVHAWIGLTLQDLDPGMAEYLDIKPGSGLVIQTVESESPADKAGIKEGDILLKADKKSMGKISDYQAAMRGAQKGDIIEIKVLQDGREKQFNVEAGVFPEKLAPKLVRRLLGIRVDDLEKSGLSGRSITADSGVVITEVDSRSVLGKIGARAGDVIRKIDEMPVDGLDDFYKAVIKYRWKNSVVLLLQRGNQGYYITVNF